MTGVGLTEWAIFAAIILGALYIDLQVVGKKHQVLGRKDALLWSFIWISLALSFNVLVYIWNGPKSALEFTTGYIIEESLSVDNLFVFIIIFSYFGVKGEYQRRVLFWGIIGAFVMRGAMILLGVSLIQRFEWISYIFGIFLVYTGIKIGTENEVEIHPEDNVIVKYCRKLLPVTKDFHGSKFFIRDGAKLMATPLFVSLLVIESSDLLFAVDSVPAILSITTDPFIVYSSNVFAILGLRSLYFLLAGMMETFKYLKLGISGVLVFVGAKMLLPSITELVFHQVYKIPTEISLLVVAGTLGLSVIASLAVKGKDAK
ncbi:MAG: TerC family protein [Candidatus Aenigmarchaeota archaeon]|nr:TerC family protein [Candidatus Aenigmarchaeota archaeon]